MPNSYSSKVITCNSSKQMLIISKLLMDIENHMTIAINNYMPCATNWTCWICKISNMIIYRRHKASSRLMHYRDNKNVHESRYLKYNHGYKRTQVWDLLWILKKVQKNCRLLLRMLPGTLFYNDNLYIIYI